jgi:signal transduction histidine kinase
MKNSRILFIISFFAVILSECHYSQIKPAISGSGSEFALLDSIKKLDSLSFATRLTNNAMSQMYASKALALAALLNDPEGFIIAWTSKANSFPSSPSDSEFIYLSKALSLSDQSNIVNHKPGLLANLALLYYSTHNAQKAMLLCDSSIILADKLRKYEAAADAFNILGNIHFDAMDYKAARVFYDSSYRIAQKHNLLSEIAMAGGNLAKMEKSPGKKRELLKQAVVKLRNSATGRDVYTDVLINIGNTFDNPDSAMSYYLPALIIAKSARLPFEEIAAYNNLAYSYLDKGQMKEAKSSIIDHAIPLAQSINNLEWLSTLYDSYSDVLSAGSDLKEAIKYEKKSIAIGNEASKQAAAGQVRLLSAMLDLKNKEVVIRDKDQEINRHVTREKVLRFWFAITAMGLIIFVFLFIVSRLQSKLKIQQQKAESSRRIIEIEENEKRKLSMDLHDLSGQVKMELLEQFNRINIPEGNEKTQMMTRINSLSGHIRAISHRMSRISIDQYDIVTLITGICEEFREFSGLDIQLSGSAAIPPLSDETKLHIFRILQEILANAGKYAKNAHIKIDLSVSSGNFVIIYSDNGPGFSNDLPRKGGMGLLNIHERCKLLGGNSILDSSPGYGVHWEIKIPLLQNILATVQ